MKLEPAKKFVEYEVQRCGSDCWRRVPNGLFAHLDAACYRACQIRKRDPSAGVRVIRREVTEEVVPDA